MSPALFPLSFCSLLGVCAALPAQQLPVTGVDADATSSMSMPLVPIHTAVDDPAGGAYGTWAAGPGYKASFDDGMTFVPMLGADAPESARLHWRTASVRVGAHELLGDAPRGHRAGDLRYEYRNGAVVEAYEVRHDGLEQTFVIAERPAASGDLVIVGEVDGNVVGAPRTAQHAALSWSLESFGGRAVIGYGAATAIDAAGRQWPMSTAYDDGHVTLRLDAAALAAARFPLVVDPLLGNLVFTMIPGLRDVDVLRDDEQSADNVWLVYSAHASATDADLFVVRQDDAFVSGGEAVVYADVTTGWSTFGGQLAGTGGSNAGKVIAAFTRDFPNGLRRVRWHLHAKNDLTLTTGFGQLATVSGTNESSPDVGGSRASSVGSHALIVYQRDTGATWSNTATSEVLAARIDVTVGINGSVLDSAIPLGASSGDEELPSINQEAQGGVGYSWLVAWQFHNNTFDGDWDVVAQRVHADYGFDGNPRYIANSDAHEMSPKVAGADGRYLIAFTDKTSPLTKPLEVEADTISARRVSWPHTAPNGQLPFPRRTVMSNANFSLQLGGCAFDLDTRSHWAVLAADVAVGTRSVRLAKLGYEGAVVEELPCYQAASYELRNGGVCFDGDGHRFLAVYGFDNLTTTQRLIATRLAYQGVAAPTVYNTSCAQNTTVSHAGCQHVGSQFETFTVNSTLPGVGALFAASLNSANGSLQPFGMNGCVLSVDPTAPYLLGTVLLVTDAVGDATLTLPVPSTLPPFPLFTQWLLLDPAANPAGISTTAGLAVPFAR
ncbi:MAG: hypothetical protein R3F29_10040 [Planctomycetota bacterium]